MPQKRAASAEDQEFGYSGIVGEARLVSGRAQIESKLFGRSFVGIVVNDVERRAHVRRKLVGLSPFDELPDAVAEAQRAAAMLEPCDAGGAEILDADDRCGREGIHHGLPQLNERPES